MTLVAQNTQPQIVVAGVDTHADTHVVAVLTMAGQLLDAARFAADSAGDAALTAFVASFGVIDRIGVEVTGAYGAGLTRYLRAAGIEVLEVDIPHPHRRARSGKDDFIDAEEAARKVLAGVATTIPKDTTGPVEAIRVLKVARDGAVKARTAALQQGRDLLVTAPAEIREAVTGKGLATRLRHFLHTNPDPARIHEPGTAVTIALRAIAHRVADLDAEITELDRHLDTLTTQHAPTLRALPQVGPQAAAQLLITAGTIQNRIPSEAALARLTGVAPIPIASGKTHRHRLHRGGDRQANRTIHLIAVGRLRYDPRSRAYRDRRTQDGLSKKDIIRCLKRYLCREIHQALKTDLGWT